MRTKRIFTLCLSFLAGVALLAAPSIARAERESHGGDPRFRMRWYAVRDILLKSWTPTWSEWLGLSKDEFIKRTQPGLIEIEPVSELPKGLVGRNFLPSREFPMGKIEVLTSWWQDSERSLTERLLLELHEYLSFFEKDRNYELTLQVLAFRGKNDDGRIILDTRDLITNTVNRLLHADGKPDGALTSSYVKHRCGNGLYRAYDGPKDACVITIGITREVIDQVEPLEVANATEDAFGKVTFETHGKSAGYIAQIALTGVSREEELLEAVLHDGAITLDFKDEYKERLQRMHGNLLQSVMDRLSSRKAE